MRSQTLIRVIGAHILCAHRHLFVLLSPYLQGFAQQDAHEALRTILNEVHDNTLINMPLGLGSGAIESGAGTSTVSAANPLYVSQRGLSSDSRQESLPTVATNPMRSKSGGSVAPEAAERAVVDGDSAGNKRRRGAEGGKERDSDEDSDTVTARPAPALGREWLHHGPYTGAETVPRSVISDVFQGLLCSRVRCRYGSHGYFVRQRWCAHGTGQEPFLPT
jgi:hypothetical protein